jgi:hypothetical protein
MKYIPYFGVEWARMTSGTNPVVSMECRRALEAQALPLRIVTYIKSMFLEKHREKPFVNAAYSMVSQTVGRDLL